MASVTQVLFTCDNGLASGSLTYDDVTLEWLSFTLVNNRTGDLVITVTDTSTGNSWTYTARAGRTVTRSLPRALYRFFAITPSPDDPDPGLSLGTFAIELGSA